MQSPVYKMDVRDYIYIYVCKGLIMYITLRIKNQLLTLIYYTYPLQSNDSNFLDLMQVMVELYEI